MTVRMRDGAGRWPYPLDPLAPRPKGHKRIQREPKLEMLRKRMAPSSPRGPWGCGKRKGLG